MGAVQTEHADTWGLAVVVWSDVVVVRQGSVRHPVTGVSVSRRAGKLSGGIAETRPGPTSRGSRVPIVGEGQRCSLGMLVAQTRRQVHPAWNRKGLCGGEGR